MSYKAFASLKESIEIETIEKMSSKEINVLLNNQCEKMESLIGLLIEADEYLNTNSLTAIGHNSILHKKFKEAVNT